MGLKRASNSYKHRSALGYAIRSALGYAIRSALGYAIRSALGYAIRSALGYAMTASSFFLAMVVLVRDFGSNSSMAAWSWFITNNLA